MDRCGGEDVKHTCKREFTGLSQGFPLKRTHGLTRIHAARLPV